MSVYYLQVSGHREYCSFTLHHDNWRCVSVYEHVLNGFMAQLNSTVLLSAPELVADKEPCAAAHY